jgi:opacity protein-like surface antigen
MRITKTPEGIMFRRIAVAVSLALMTLGSQADAEISADLMFCSKLQKGSERLACYDAAARLEKRGPTPGISTRVVKSVETAVVHSPKNWDGAFVGIGATAGNIRSGSQGSYTGNPGGEPNVSVGGATTTPVSTSAKGSGAAVDLRAGYTAQISSLVVGVQGDLLLPAIRADEGIFVGRCDNPACTRNFNFNNQGSLSANWVISAVAKAGWVTPDNANLLYALGGISYADFSSNVASGVALSINGPYQLSFPRVGFATSGWTAGLGWERRIADAWNIYAEYRFSRFANYDQQHLFSYTPCALGLTCTATTQMAGSLDLQSIRLGVSRTFSILD